MSEDTALTLAQETRPEAKESWLEALTISLDGGDVQLTEEERFKLSRQMRLLRTGINSVVPIICPGEDCPFRQTCPFIQMGKFPLGKQCLVEKDLIIYNTIKYATQYEVDSENFVDQDLVKELVELDVYEFRAAILLATRFKDMMYDVVAGFDAKTGELITTKQVAPIMDLKLRIKARKLKVHEALVGTRREQYKKDAALKIKSTPDTSKKYADLRAKIDGMKQVKVVEGEFVEAE